MRALSLLPLVALVLTSSACSNDLASEDDEGPAEGASEGALSGAFPVGTPLVTTSSAALRQTPSPSAAVLATIPGGARVASASAQPRSGWYGVTWGGKTGWVSGAYLSKDTSGSFSRQQVYQLVQGHMRPGAEQVAKDLLDSSLTSQKLVDAIGWLATSSPPAWEISAINSNHHYDPAAHSGGYAVDLYVKNAGDDLRFVQLVVKDPHFVEIGFSGDYVKLQSEVRGKYYFTENAPTHVHASVKQAYGSYR